MKLLTRLQLFLLCQLQFLTEGTDKNACGSELRWAPVILRREIFVAFVNHATCPSWTTQYSYPIRPTWQNQLVLPKEEPFAFICGACYPTSRLSANLTATVDGTSNFLTNVPLQSPQDTTEHNRNSFVSCLVTYVLTSPLKAGGTFTCQLHRGSKVHEDQVHFSLRKVTDYDSKEIKEQVNDDGKAILNCPTTDLQSKSNLAYVWHFPQSSVEASGQKQPFIVVPSMGPQITYRSVKKEEVVTCSAYDFMNPWKVWRNVHKVIGPTKKLKESHSSKWGTTGEELQPDSNPLKGKKIKRILIIVGSIAGIITVSVIIIFVSTGACSSRKRRNSHSGCQKGDQSLLQQRTIYGG